MMKRLLTFLFMMLAVPVWAQEVAVVPETQEQMTLSFAPVVKKAAPAVVNIYTKRKERVQVSPFGRDPFFEQFFGQQFGGFRGMTRERVVASLGSGVIIEPDGLIVSSHHVIAGAQDIIVQLSDKREFKASIILEDEASDLAFLQLQEVEEDLPFLSVISSDTIEVGDLVLAMGNPFGVGQTVTSGIVSALARSAKGVSDFEFFIQTDAAINPGNSGGALVDMKGNLVGVNTAIYSRSGGSNGIGFAIPSNMVLSLKENMQGDGTVLRPYLGAAYQDVTREIAESLDMKAPRGVLVAKIIEASPADTGGLKVGDVILAVNGEEVDDVEALKYRVATGSTKGWTRFRVLRKGSKVELAITLAVPPEEPARDTRFLKGSHPLNGLTVENLSPRVALEHQLPLELKGVIVSKAAGPVGLKPTKGDIIVSLNGEAIVSTEQLEGLLSGGGPEWDVVFKRGGKTLNLSIRR